MYVIEKVEMGTSHLYATMIDGEAHISIYELCQDMNIDPDAEVSNLRKYKAAQLSWASGIVDTMVLLDGVPQRRVLLSPRAFAFWGDFVETLMFLYAPHTDDTALPNVPNTDTVQ
jgi:hypothetical protein